MTGLNSIGEAEVDSRTSTTATIGSPGGSSNDNDNKNGNRNRNGNRNYANGVQTEANADLFHMMGNEVEIEDMPLEGVLGTGLGVYNGYCDCAWSHDGADI